MDCFRLDVEMVSRPRVRRGVWPSAVRLLTDGRMMLLIPVRLRSSSDTTTRCVHRVAILASVLPAPGRHRFLLWLFCQPEFACAIPVTSSRQWSARSKNPC